ncbi:hypothetical protein OENI_500043 [Oenococcus oeni]|nr:hypothetical protein OENI_500043 [Oenococcus oeni]
MILNLMRYMKAKKAFLLNELISITLKNRNRKVVSLKMKLALT